jgi:hypothetical protein
MDDGCYQYTIITPQSLNASASTVTGWTIEESGFEFQQGQEILIFSTGEYLN